MARRIHVFAFFGKGMDNGAMSLFSLLFENPLLFVVLVLVFLCVLSFHEYAHALVGYWLGDHTAKQQNRLTLNPFAHVDPLGFLALLTVGFGWGKPVPFNPYNLRYRRFGPALVALAGPAANFLFGAVTAILLRFLSPVLGDQNLLVAFLFYASYINFVLMLFNLIPVPPLDGSKLLFAILDDPRYDPIRFFLESRGTYLLLALIFLEAFAHIGIFSWISGLANSLILIFAR